MVAVVPFTYSWQSCLSAINIWIWTVKWQPSIYDGLDYFHFIFFVVNVCRFVCGPNHIVIHIHAFQRKFMAIFRKCKQQSKILNKVKSKHRFYSLPSHRTLQVRIKQWSKQTVVTCCYTPCLSLRFCFLLFKRFSTVTHMNTRILYLSNLNSLP